MFVLFLCSFSFHAFQYVDLSYFHSLLFFLIVFCFASVLLVFLFCISYVFFVLFCFCFVFIFKARICLICCSCYFVLIQFVTDFVYFMIVFLFFLVFSSFHSIWTFLYLSRFIIISFIFGYSIFSFICYFIFF